MDYMSCNLFLNNFRSCSLSSALTSRMSIWTPYMHACMHAPYWHMHMTATILFDGLDRLLHTRLVSIYSQSLAVILRPLSSFWEDAREQWRSRGNCFFTTGIELVFGREHILTHWLIEVRFFLPLPLGERQNTVLNEISFLSLFIFIFCDQE